MNGPDMKRNVEKCHIDITENCITHYARIHCLRLMVAPVLMGGAVKYCHSGINIAKGTSHTVQKGKPGAKDQR